MATATHTGRSPHTTTEPFPTLDVGSKSPVSRTSATVPTTAATPTDNPNLLKPNSPQTTDVAHSPKSNKPGSTLRTSPVPLTGAAAMAELRKKRQQQAAQDARETSPNPAAQAVQSLMGVGGMSKPSDAPGSTKLSEPLQKVAEKIRVPETTQGDSLRESPVSMASFSTLDSAGSALTATASNASASGHQGFVAEPAQMADTSHHNGSNGSLGATAGDDGHKAFSYPGPPPQESSQEGGSRRMSHPGYGQSSPKSPASAKRHKCPYCDTDFTRHHNLKSHLLTHSQEKPYICQTCQARFRRLHDLKRHSKLHTGERPHTCDKCGRRFARGDALARHNKGPGGCAGRRSSFGGDDDFGDGVGGESMEGIEYTGEEDDGSSPDHGRRGSEPSRKRVHLETTHDPHRQIYRQASNTYPPVYPPPQNRPHAGSMGPPQVVLPGTGGAQVNSPHDLSNQPSPAGGGGGSSLASSSYYSQPAQVFAQQGGMTESPKPLSPGQQPPQDQHRLSVGDSSLSSAMHRNRSPSLTTQFQQAHFGRVSDGRTPPSGAPVLPPLGSGGGGGSAAGGASSRILSSSGAAGSSLLHNSHVPPGAAGSASGHGSNPGSLSSHSHGQSSGGSMRDALGGPEHVDIWAYVRQLDQRFSRMQDEYELRISRLQEEVISLRGQVAGPGQAQGVGMGQGMGAGAGSYGSEMGQPRY